MALGYILNPAFQYEDINGKPLVGGFLRVYVHGTTNHAVTYKDFTGDLNPNDIVLNNKGMAVILADSALLYDVYCYDRNGVEQWSRLSVGAVGGGSGGLVNVVSSDGSLNVDKTVESALTTYDITVNPDANDLLEWIRCDGSERLPDSTTYKPTYTEGTMEVGTSGLVLGADRYYHVTAHVRATKNEQREPYYDNMAVAFKIFDGENTTSVTTSNIIVDYSMGLSQDYEISTDVFAQSESELLIDISGQHVQGGTFSLVDVEVHRVYSGAPAIPSGVLSRSQAADIYQPILTAGDNITIDEHNVISAAGTTYTAGNGIDITSDVISVDTSVVATQTDLEGKQDVLTAGDNITIQNNVISATAAPQEQADWTESDTESVSYIKHKPTELPAAIDNGVELIAGQNITLTNTLAGLVISASGGGGGGGSTPWTYAEDTAFDITVTASDAFSSYFERLVPITSQAVLNSGKDFAMFYQCIVEADSSNPPSTPDMTPIKLNVYNYPNHNIDEITGIFTTLGGAALQTFASHGSVVLGTQMLSAGRLFSVFFPQGSLAEGDKFHLIVRAVYIELTGVN